MPRDRLNLFKNTIIERYQRTLKENISDEKIRNIVNSALSSADAFNNKKNTPVYLCFFDPIKRNYNDGIKRVEKECIELALGIHKHGKPRMFITDGLNGLEDAIKDVFPRIFDTL